MSFLRNNLLYETYDVDGLVSRCIITHMLSMGVCNVKIIITSLLPSSRRFFERGGFNFVSFIIYG